jgi:hypothetical protein
LLRPFLVLGLLSAATGAYADPQPLTGDVLKSLSGSLVEIDTPLGTKLPVRFGSDGLVSAEAGDLAPILGSAKDRGRWWVDGEKLCTKWFRWFDSEVRCITVAKDGTRLYWRKDDGETGTATLIEDPSAKKDVVVVAEASASNDKPVRDKLAAKTPEKSPDPSPKAAAAETPSAPPAVTAEAAPAPVAPPAADPVQTSQPVVVAEAAPAAPEEAPDEHKMMRFGGEGLLAAAGPIEVKSAALAPATAAPEARDAEIDDKLSPLRREGSSKKPATAQQPKKPVAANPPPASAAHAVVPAPAPPQAPAQPLSPSGKSLEVANFEAPSAPAARSDVAKGRAAQLPLPRQRPSSLYRVQGVERYDVLNVRRGPSESYDPIASIPPTGRSVEITGQCQDTWCPIRYGRVRGWVNSYYLVAEGTPGSSSQSQVYLAKP